MTNQIDEATLKRLAMECSAIDYEPFQEAIQLAYSDLPKFANTLLTHMQEGNEAVGMKMWEEDYNKTDKRFSFVWWKEVPYGTKLYTSPPNTQAKLDKAIEALKLLKDATCISERAVDFGQLQRWVNKIASKALSTTGEDNG